MSEYFDQLRATLDGVVAHLTAKGIMQRHLAFGGEGEIPARKTTVPTDARSEFLANRAMGDWAEQALSVALRQALPEWKIAQYGDTNRIAAGHPDFKASYLAGIEETRRYGKRPDLLLFPQTLAVDADLSERAHAETEGLVKQAASAIEVRSSKFEALTYMAVRQRQREAGNSRARDAEFHREGRGPYYRLSLAGAARRAAKLLSGFLRLGLCDQLPRHLCHHWQRHVLRD